jgi:hypothetical protein
MGRFPEETKALGSPRWFGYASALARDVSLPGSLFEEWVWDDCGVRVDAGKPLIIAERFKT